MIPKTNLAPNHTVILDCDTAADACLCRYDNPFTDIAVVTDVDQIVQLRATTYSSATQGAAIHASILRSRPAWSLPAPTP